VKGVCDRLVAYSFGLLFLIRNKIDVVANEWSGPFGRERATYFLRAAAFLRYPIYSLPHGYFLWLNPLFNKTVIENYRTHGSFPDFSDRDFCTKYVVQSPEHKKENIEYGINPNKLLVLGSARFCEEWASINYDLLCKNSDFNVTGSFTVLFFLPHWDYNVRRERCISLLEQISMIENVHLEVKAHTRGTGALNSHETNLLSVRSNVEISDESIHSTQLVSRADVVVNFGSSIAFEALRQGKPVINPTYLHDNQTFFDCSGAVIDTKDDISTLNEIIDIQLGRGTVPDKRQVARFLHCRVDGSDRNPRVLDSYVDLLLGRDV